MIVKSSFLNSVLFIFFIFMLTNNTLYGQSFRKTNNLKKKFFAKEDFKDWYIKDINNDTIPGVSLERAYSEILKNKKGKEVIVAVIDTKLDIHHEDLKDQIWINKDEIPANNIDDDNNGFDCPFKHHLL